MIDHAIDLDVLDLAATSESQSEQAASDGRAIWGYIGTHTGRSISVLQEAGGAWPQHAVSHLASRSCSNASALLMEVVLALS